MTLIIRFCSPCQHIIKVKWDIYQILRYFETHFPQDSLEDIAIAGTRV